MTSRFASRALLLLGLSSAAALLTGLWIEPALAQSLTFDLGDNSGSTTGRLIQLLALMTVLSLAPSILVMVT
ncbi:MAG: flagellar biosynthetic protein FliP, partial [Alphaproteobacteria bacterium]|nr:flagellar biosynthetic protein FliP [Alphaproteobacteria bacterium]